MGFEEMPTNRRVCHHDPRQLPNSLALLRPGSGTLTLSSSPNNILPATSKTHSIYPTLRPLTNLGPTLMTRTIHPPSSSSARRTKRVPPWTTSNIGTRSAKCTKRANLAPSVTVTPGTQTNLSGSFYARTRPQSQLPCCTNWLPTRGRRATSPSTGFSAMSPSMPRIWRNSTKWKV